MLILLPPSETKRPGGIPGTSLDLAALSFPELTGARRTTIAAVRRLSRNLTTAAAALGLGPKSIGEAALNRELGTSPVLPAIDRFDGVLFDALDAPSLSADARDAAARHLVVHSALFGLVGALDPLPAYRLSAATALPGATQRGTWRAPVSAVLAARPGLLLDLRSEAYAALGPIPRRDDAIFLRVVTAAPDGRRRALNHFNKHAKGEFSRALLRAGVDLPDVPALLRWAADAGFHLEHGAPRELDLVV